MGLAACPRASFAWVEGGGGRLFCGLVPQMCLERCGGYRPASALSALRSGIAKGAINAAWDAIGEVKDGLRLKSLRLRRVWVRWIGFAEPAHARQTESELSSVLAQSQPSACARSPSRT